jgi:hypothetical protein
VREVVLVIDVDFAFSVDISGDRGGIGDVALIEDGSCRINRTHIWFNTVINVIGNANSIKPKTTSITAYLFYGVA